MSTEHCPASWATPPEPRRIVLTDDGPALVDGPVDVVTADGTVLHCDRFVVALCLCRRSSTYPLCDTSHRRRRRREQEGDR
ncbi:CDGSH iron-sulfur domain-containing protein [Nocardia sp. NPDC058497]|uniref:CDGSH iron-sulfur domain-containing protein n=1 Tax=Nocardia sp. NPDC058497 TaxID=3346529 RepID=UPI0036519A29